jgi:hypothetical protein
MIEIISHRYCAATSFGFKAMHNERMEEKPIRDVARSPQVQYISSIRAFAVAPGSEKSQDQVACRMQIVGVCLGGRYLRMISGNRNYYTNGMRI